MDASFFLNSSNSAFSVRFSDSNWLHFIHFDLDPVLSVLDCRDAFRRPVSSSSLSVIIFLGALSIAIHVTLQVMYNHVAVLHNVRSWSAYIVTIVIKIILQFF